MTNLHRPFLDAILHDPDSDEPRLVYADWLSERDDPRGEFIRVQCEEASLPRFSKEAILLRRRGDELLATHRKDWAGELDELLYQYRFHRGFINWGRLSPTSFLESGSKICDTTPLESVVLVRGGDLNKLDANSAITRLRGVLVQKCRDSTALETFLESSATSHLSELGVSECGEIRLDLLSQRPSLRRLFCRDTTLSMEHFDGFASDQLESLRLFLTRLDFPYERLMVGNPFPRLESLSLVGRESPLEDLDWLNEGYSKLTSVEFCDLDPACLDRFPDRKEGQLEHIGLFSFRSDVEPLESLDAVLGSPLVANLRSLSLEATWPTQAACNRLAFWDGIRDLRSLRVSGNTYVGGQIAFEDLDRLFKAGDPDCIVDWKFPVHQLGESDVRELNARHSVQLPFPADRDKVIFDSHACGWDANGYEPAGALHRS